MEDRLIIERVLSGDTEAFAQLVDRHYDRCARIALRILANREDAEEAVQDAFVRAYRALGSYEDRERFAAWLSRILVNQCRSIRTRESRRDSLFAGIEGAEVALPHAWHDDAAWPDLERALAQLPAGQREAIVLHYADDLTYDEMARVTGSGVSALKMRVRRGLERLRALLSEVYSG